MNTIARADVVPAPLPARRFLGLLSLLAAASLSACGGGGGSGNNGGGPSPTNGAPAARTACTSTSANNAKTGTLPATSPQGRALTYTIIEQPKKGSLSADAAGNYSYVPRTGVRGMDQFKFQVTDSQGQTSNIATFTVLIDGAVRIMPLGDSITEGTSIGGSSDLPPPGQRVAYRRKLFSDLEALSPNYSVNFVGSQSNGSSASPAIGDPDHEGHGGYCDGPGIGNSCSFGNVASNVIGWLNTNPADVILLHVGTNDFETNNPNDVAMILDNIESWAANNFPVSVFLARTIPTRDGTLDVETYNNNVDTVAGDRPHVTIFRVDQQGALAVSGSPNVANASYMGDNLHPNQAGYDRMADAWKAEILEQEIMPTCP